MPASAILTEVGLTMIFVSWTLTRRFQRRALGRYGYVGVARLAERAGLVVPVWVSFCNVLGWVLSIVAGTWLTVHFGD